MPPPPKTDAKPGAKGEAAAEPVAAAPAPAKAAPGGIKAFLPLILALTLSPAATWATVEFVLLPRLQKKIATGAPAEAAEAAPAAEHASSSHGSSDKHDKNAKKEAAGFEFSNVVVNISGTMGTRYLKTNVHVVGANPNLKSIFEGSKPRLTDITQSVLASLTLADIEEPGSKNVIRAKLVNAYNQALSGKIVEEIYLTDFVVQ